MAGYVSRFVIDFFHSSFLQQSMWYKQFLVIHAT